MADINLHPGDKVMSGLEVAKGGGSFVVGLLIFEVMFYAMYLEGEVIPAALCGIPMGLMMVAIASQCVMHFLGLGKMVMNEGTMAHPQGAGGAHQGVRGRDMGGEGSQLVVERG